MATMEEVIRIFVGTDERQEKADRVLEYTIRKHASLPVEITWMRAGEGMWSKWKYSPDIPDSGGWHTKFTCFRYAIPELCNFKGKAIYLDSDMVVLGDIAEIWSTPLSRGPWHCLSRKRTDVSVIDCARMKQSWWPPLSSMMRSHKHGAYFRGIIIRNGFLDPSLPPEWNVIDEYKPRVTKLIHFSRVQTQPWKPWPEGYSYNESHACPEAVRVWEEAYEESFFV